jgi:hypothetical protein
MALHVCQTAGPVIQAVTVAAWPARDRCVGPVAIYGSLQEAEEEALPGRDQSGVRGRLLLIPIHQVAV